MTTQALKLALEAFKSGDLRDIEAATDAIKQALEQPQMTPKEQFIRESLRIKTEMIKELINERDSHEYRIELMSQEITKLKDELTRLKS